MFCLQFQRQSFHPALQEQWGLVVNEACAAGLPILSSRTVGACHELVQDGKNGLLFDPESVPDMTRALLTMHQLDLDARLQMGQLSKSIVANYGVQNFAEGFINAVNIPLATTRQPKERVSHLKNGYQSKTGQNSTRTGNR